MAGIPSRVLTFKGTGFSLRFARTLSTGLPSSSRHVEWKDNVARSAFPEIAKAPYTYNFTEYITRNFNEYGDKVAILDGITHNQRTFRDLNESIKSVARGLQQVHGLRHGDCVSLMSPNHVDFFSAFHGPVKLGAAVSCINPLYTKYEVEQHFRKSKTKLVIAHEDCMESVTGALEIMGRTDIPIISLADFGQRSDPKSFEHLRLSYLESALESLDSISPKFDGDTLAALPFSSGTTGLPKGTMLTHNNLIANLLQLAHVETNHLRANDVFLSPLPLFHIYAFTCSLHGPLVNGNTLVTMKNFDLNRFCELVQETHATHAHIVPPIILALSKTVDFSQYNFESLRVIMSAAAPLGSDQEKELSDVLPGVIVKQAWGMSELSPIGTFHHDDHVKPGSGSCGLPVASTEVKVVDLETDQALPVGEEGELCIRGPQVMKGYLDEPEKTKECLDEDGWLRTGDIARIDEEGYVYITDRLKDLIKYKGFQVAPAELESVLCTHPDVNDACVIPVPSDEAGEVPRAYVGLRKTVAPTDEKIEELLEYVANRVAPHKKLRGGIGFLDPIPKSAAGKILRRQVIEHHVQNSS